MSEKRKVLKGAGIVGLLTLVSRFTGLIRDSITGAMFGATSLSDTFLVAFEIPNLIRRVMGEGALSAFIVPLLVKRRQEQGEQAGWDLLNVTLNFLLVIALIISIFGVCFSQQFYIAFGGLGQLMREKKAVEQRENPSLVLEEDIQNAAAFAPLINFDDGQRAADAATTAPTPQTRQRAADALNVLIQGPLLSLPEGMELTPRALRLPLTREQCETPTPQQIQMINRRLLELRYPGALEINQATLISLGTYYARIMFPYAIGLTLSALLMGACHALGRFTAASLGSVMLNISMIGVGGTALALGISGERSAVWLCWAVLAGGALRLVVMAPTLMSRGWRWRPVFNLSDPDLIRLLKMMGLGILGMSIGQVSIVVSNLFATALGTGLKAYITFANRLIQFPMALTATAVATAMLPQMTAFLLEGRKEEMRDMMGFVKRLELILMVPATAGLVFLGQPIMQLIFERGNWTAQATAGAWWALVFYAPCLLPMGWGRVMVQLCYARHDLITPLKASAVGVVVSIVLNWLLGFHVPLLTRLGIPQAGLAMAFTLGAMANYWSLAWWMKRDFGPLTGPGAQLGETFWKSAAAALMACALGWVGYWHALVGLLGAPLNFASRALYLLPVIAGVMALYFVFIRLMRVPDSRQATDMILKKLRRRGGPGAAGSKNPQK